MNLQYRSERDKAYGLAGMTVTLVALNGEEYLRELDLDAPDADAFVFENVYALKANPRMSAKVVWQQTLRDLRLMTSLSLGNIHCRRVLLDSRRPDRDEMQAVADALAADAAEHLGFDVDEAYELFNATNRYAMSLFNHDGVQAIAQAFADRLIEQRHIAAVDAFEFLAARGLS
ncbi:MAG: hypothetical protein K2M55_05320 [Muribaculaceae bacterium]|nr:hypothetical protein [Muribaculaceae bacterium]